MESFTIMALTGYLVLINSALFVLMGVDKSKAKKHQWRIPEKTLLLLGVIGGGFGGLLGQKVFRHKTRKPVFYVIFTIGAFLAATAVYLLM